MERAAKMSPRLDDRARPPIRPGSDDDAAGDARERRGRREGGKGRRATNLGSLAAVVAAAAAAACLVPRGATAQFLSVPDTFLSSTDPSAPCPVDVDDLRLDPGLGEACDPGVQGDNLCDACVCDMALRLAEAGYRITGPDAVPFQACALQNLLALQQRGGLSIGGMMEVSRRCKSAPACIREISDDFFAKPPETPSGGGAAAPTASILLDDDDDDDDSHDDAQAGAPIDVECEGQGCVLAGLVAAAPREPDSSARSHSPNLASPPPDVFAASIAVPVVLGCFLIWLVAFCVGRERRRARLAAAFGPVPVGGGAGIGAGGVDTAGGAEARVSAGIGEVRFDDVVVVAGAGGRGKTPSRRLLDGVSGTCRRGELLGLLGPSGAGKSTLLNVVAGRVDLVRGMRQTGGVVALDDVPTRSRRLSRQVAYVPQHDTHLPPYLTVFETVMYSAELQLPWFTSTSDKHAKALAVLHELSLASVADSRVGADDGNAGGGGTAVRSTARHTAKVLGEYAATSPVVGAMCRRASSAGSSRREDESVGHMSDTNNVGECRKTTSDHPGKVFRGTGCVSGGERRRVSVAMELVTGPDVLVLDEPTSGLDAHAAASMVRTLRHLATRGTGRVVIFSVHQPSPRAFQAIDNVILLGPGGKRLWSGAPRDADEFFTRAGLPCPEEDLDGGMDIGALENIDTSRGLENIDTSGGLEKIDPAGAPAGSSRALAAGLSIPPPSSSSPSSSSSYRVDVSEWMLEVAACPARRATLAAAAAAAAAPSSMSTPSYAKVPSASASAPSLPTPPSSDRPEPATAKTLRHRSWITETRVLLGRAGRTIARDPSLLVAHLLVASMTAVVLGWLYLDSPKSLAGFQNRAGGIFFTLVFFGLGSTSAADRLAAESATRAREIQSGYHGAGSYVLSALVTDVACLRAPAAAAYALVFYFLMGLKAEASAFFTFLGVLELFVVCTAAMSSLVSLCFDVPAVANLIATSLQLLGAMFGGFLVSIQNVAPYLRWIQWLSVYRYAWGAMLASEMDGQTFLFDVNDFEGARVQMLVGGQTYLNTFALDPRNVPRDAAALGGIFAALALACWARLHLRFATQRS